MMNGCVVLPKLSHSLNQTCKRLLLAQIQKQILPPVACFAGIRDKGGKKTRHSLYGFILLTALGSGGALLLSTQNFQKQRWDDLIIRRIEDTCQKYLADSDDFYVGVDDDWHVYSSSQNYSEFGSKIYVFVSDIINFNINRIWDWLYPWEQSESDDPWVLLDLTKSRNFWVRQMGVASLADKTDWEEYKYRTIAQACDHRTCVALARYPQANDAYFLLPPKLQPSQRNIVAELRSQLSKLPMPDFINSCEAYYRLVALDQEIPFQKDPLAMDFVTQHYSLPGEEERKKEKVLGYCLEAIASYTAKPLFACLFVENHGLAVLQRLHHEMTENWVQMYVATILSNLSQVSELLDDLVSTGWVSILRQWSRSNNAALSLLALTTLSNLDRDWISRDLYQDMVLLHPTQRNSQPVYADVVFVHGLRGGAVKTWRQRDPSQDQTKSQSLPSPCWPRDWLAKDCPNVRIISIGYSSMLHRWGDHCPYEQEKRTIEGRSRELIRKLQQAGVGSRPIVWIGHSMGGLLIKQIMSLGEHESEYSQFSTQTKGVVFYSVPHHGSSVVDTMMYAKYLLFPSVEVQEMCTTSPKLTLLHQNFLNFMRKNSIPCLSIGENAKTPFGRPLPKLLVVPPDSSDPGIGKFVSVPDNHINTCKPCSQEDTIYQLTRTFVQEILDQIR